MRLVRFIFLALISLAVAASERVMPFSALKPGDALVAPFNHITLPKLKPNTIALVDADGKTVLHVDSDASASTLGIPLQQAAGTSQRLNWRWKVSRVLDKADISKKTGDDLAARVYVFFDVPLASLSFGARTKIRLARMLAGADVPTAAICYVWDNHRAVGHTQNSAYTDRVRMIVLKSGEASAGNWANESRDVAADFKAAFGTDAPAVTGVALGSDTDQTGERVSAWFGDIGFSPAPAAPQ